MNAKDARRGRGFNFGGVYATDEQSEVRALRGKKARGKEPAPGGGADFMLKFLNIAPLLAIPVALYNLIAFTTPGGQSAVPDQLARVMLSVPMVTGGSWPITAGDIVLIFALVTLFWELLKSTSSGVGAIINHAMSMVLFIICLIEFLLAPAFATTVFFMIMIMTLLDTLAGVVVTINAARRDVSVRDNE